MFSRSLILFGAATVLLGQTPPPSPPPMPQVHFSVENPPIVKQPDVPPDRVVITVGDIKITAAQFNALIANLQPQLRAQAQGAGRKALADNIVKMLTLAQEAQKRKLDQTSDFKAQEMFQNFSLLANTLAGQVGKDIQLSETDVRQYYDAHKNEFETVHARHILIRFTGSQVPVRPGQKDLTDAEALAKAQELRKKIQDGADFATIAKAESDDVGSGSSGGDMPAFKHGQMVPSFETAAFAMKAGELSEPVKSQFGYHIILVVSHDTKSFEEVRADLENRMKPEQGQKAVNKFIDDLQKANPPLLDPEFFIPPPPVPPAPGLVPPAIKPPDKK
jgi:peptidyl-prolyl cis-trans isomerase C